MTEQQEYTVVQVHPGFEVRRYAAHVEARVTVEGSYGNAANRAFRSLVGYIGGKNHASRSMAMTSPVLQEEPSGRSMAMTSPVLQEEAARPGTHVVGFVLPAVETMETLPAPDDPRVTLVAVPVEYAAALQYSGRWTEGNYIERAQQLRTAVRAAGLRPRGGTRWARFDPPWTPWFRRRNEVVQPIEDPDSPDDAGGDTA